MNRLNQTSLITFIIFVISISFPDGLNAQSQNQTESQAASVNEQAAILFKQGKDLMQQKKFGQAAKTFERVIALDPRTLGVYLNLTITYQALGKHRNAAAVARLEVKFNPTSAMAYNNSGYALSLLVDDSEQEAIDMLKKAIELDPKLRRAYLNLANIYRTSAVLADDVKLRSTKAAEAAVVLKDYLKIQPNDEIVLAELVGVAMVAERFQEAVATSLEWVKIKPGDFEAQKALGLAYLQNGSPADAVLTLQKAVKLKPEDVYCWRDLGVALATSDQREKALEILIKVAPDQFDLYFGLAMRAVYAEKFDDATEYFKQAVKIKPDSTAAIYQLALSYYATGNHKAALEQHAKLKAINFEDAEELLQRISR